MGVFGWNTLCLFVCISVLNYETIWRHSDAKLLLPTFPATGAYKLLLENNWSIESLSDCCVAGSDDSVLRRRLYRCCSCCRIITDRSLIVLDSQDAELVFYAVVHNKRHQYYTDCAIGVLCKYFITSCMYSFVGWPGKKWKHRTAGFLIGQSGVYYLRYFEQTLAAGNLCLDT